MKYFSLLVFSIVCFINSEAQTKTCIRFNTKVTEGVNAAPLSDVRIKIKRNDSVLVEYRTDTNGRTGICEMAYGNVYKITYYSKGYLVRVLEIDLRSIPEGELTRQEMPTDMTMYKKEDMAACETKFSEWESMITAKASYDTTNGSIEWDFAKLAAIKNDISSCLRSSGKIK